MVEATLELFVSGVHQALVVVGACDVLIVYKINIKKKAN
jgi:hypothetical protein